MTLLPIYRWVFALHVLAVLTFFLAHGASAAATFRLRRETNAERTCTLLNLSEFTIPVMFGTLLAILVLGIVAGFMGRWWSQGWIWAKFVLLMGIVVFMYVYNRAHFTPLRRAVGLPYRVRIREYPAEEPAGAEEVAVVIGAIRPAYLALVGWVIPVIIVLLVVFKPF